ncbi:hypothetical protein J1N35_013247 [Gossypium stocksii]|uniref:RNase H type-1 domain-containing protein n=1 Tax=Gossypium stocksii TaxID=47602 RepID=A0A9D3VTJ4_9ROSI|nr:hypothetical protein J1N35_013247 [Gossypium stocksii]
MGFNVLQIRGDSRTVITKCKSTEHDRSVIGAIIRDIQNLKIHFHKISFHSIPRSENTFAHFAAVEALRKGESHYLIGDVPSSVRCTVERKRLWHPD